MNAEKLQELVKQATVKVNNPYIGSDGNVVLDCWEEQLSIELLADLIVKDCASICEINGRSYKHSFTPAKARLAESTSIYCGQLIKKHFGVEE